MFREIIVDTQDVLAAVAEEFSHRATGIRGNVLHRRWTRSGRIDDDRVGIRAVVFESFLNLGHGGFLLTDGDIYANQVFALRVDDCVDSNGGLAGLAVADDQLALAAADGNHRVDCLQSSEHRLANRLAVHHPRGDAFERAELTSGVDRAAPIKRAPQRIDNPSDYFFADRHGHDSLGASYLVAFLDILVRAEQHRADFIFFEVERDARDLVRQLQKLAGHHTLEPVYFSDAVAGLNHRAYFADLEASIVALDLLAYDLAYFICSDCVHRISRADSQAQIIRRWFHLASIAP